VILVYIYLCFISCKCRCMYLSQTIKISVIGTKYQIQFRLQNHVFMMCLSGTVGIPLSNYAFLAYWRKITWGMHLQIHIENDIKSIIDRHADSSSRTRAMPTLAKAKYNQLSPKTRKLLLHNNVVRATFESLHTRLRHQLQRCST